MKKMKTSEPGFTRLIKNRQNYDFQDLKMIRLILKSFNPTNPNTDKKSKNEQHQ